MLYTDNLIFVTFYIMKQAKLLQCTKILRKKAIKAFTILGAIISLLILSFSVTAINMFLFDMLKYSTHLKSQFKMFVLAKNRTACYFAYHNEQLCAEMLKKTSKSYGKTENI